MFFEEFQVGERYICGTREVTTGDLDVFTRLSGDDHPMHTDPEYAAGTRFGEPVLHGTFGVAVAGGLWSRLGLVRDSIVAALGEQWEYHHPIRVGDRLSLAVTIVRLEEGRGGGHGAVTRFNELTNADGVVVQSGTATALVRVGSGGSRSTNRDVGTLAWGKALAAVLHESEAFRSAVASWDGAIGLRGGEREVHLRVYRGRIIDVTPRAPHGATFTFGASDRTWADLLTAADARFGARLMSGEFTASGDPYEYLRLTKALEIIVDAARTLAAPADRIEVTA
jgi:acyl dehydratase